MDQRAGQVVHVGALTMVTTPSSCSRVDTPYRSRATIQQQRLPRSTRGAWYGRQHERSQGAAGHAVAQSFFSNLKNALVHHCDFFTRDEARAAIFDYIELFYNRKRIDQSLGYRTPEPESATATAIVSLCTSNPTDLLNSFMTCRLNCGSAPVVEQTPSVTRVT
jgi:hypothetical protein